MNEEDGPLGNVYHEQVKLPLFPVYYDVFFCDDAWLAPVVISNRYPGVTLDVDTAVASMTSIITAPGKGTGIIAIFIVNDKTNIKDAIAFEAVNLSWSILSKLEVVIDEENFKIQSYVVEELNRKINEVYDRFLNMKDDQETGDNFDDL